MTVVAGLNDSPNDPQLEQSSRGPDRKRRADPLQPPLPTASVSFLIQMARRPFRHPDHPRAITFPDALQSPTEGRLRFAFVTPVTPGRNERNGFSSRLFDILAGLLEVADIELFLPQSAQYESPEAVQFWRETDGMSVHLALEPNITSDSAFVNRSRQLGRYAFGRLPTWSSIRASPDLPQTLKSRQVDAICLHLPITAHLARIVSGGMPIVFMLEEGLDSHLLAPGKRTVLRQLAARADRTRGRRLYRSLNAKASAITAISSEEADLFGADGVDRSRIVVLPHGVNPSYFEPRPTLVEAAFDVSVFGDFRFERNLAPAREVARFAAEHHPGLRLAFVGDITGPEADELRSTGATVTGRVEDMRPHYERTNIVLVPSVSGTGVKTTLLEAWAMCKPVVATPHSTRGVPAIDRVNILVGRTTPDLVRHCVTLSKSPIARERLAAKARETVEEHLDVRNIAKRLALLMSSPTRREAVQT